MRIRRLVSTAALVACFAYVGACSDVDSPRARVVVRASELTSTSTVDVQAMKTLWYAIAKQRDDVARFTAAAKNAETVRRPAAPVADAYTPAPSPVSAPSPQVVAPPGSCEQLVARYFPDDTTRAMRIVQRESNCHPDAVNAEGCDTSGRTNSHAYGYAQLCLPLHQSQFAAVGCDWTQWQNVDCYMRAWQHLVATNGWAPWGE